MTNASVNPVRSTGPAIFVGDRALQQLWLWWIAPIIGATVAGLVYKSTLKASSNRLLSGERALDGAELG